MKVLLAVIAALLTATLISPAQSPVISHFSVTDSNPIYGKETTLNWTTNNTTSVSIDPEIGSAPSSGSRTVRPLETTTYTLTASNGSNTTTDTVTISVPTPIGVTSDEFTIRTSYSSIDFPFPNQSYLESADSLLNGVNATGSGFTTDGYETVDFINGTDGNFPGGDFWPGGWVDNFAVEITATVQVNAPGKYTFIINCDDGCRLRIDGEDVIVDDGNHLSAVSSGSHTFTNPTAQLELVYYNVTGPAACELAWIRPDLTWELLDVVPAIPPIVRGGLIMSEFVANESELEDEDGVTQDWIELWNSSSSSINLAGHFLSTDPATPEQWALPNRVLAPNEYLVVFASNKDRNDPANELHTNFKLPASGSYLALKKASTNNGHITLTQFEPYPAQPANDSYGSTEQEGYIGFMKTPTPGAPNAISYTDFLKKVTFSTPRGRYDSPFSLTLSSPNPLAEIRYTLDGSEPSAGHGEIYTSPLIINSTTTLRAAAVLAGYRTSKPVTHSYLFVDDIVNQDTSYATSRGWPSAPVNGQVYEYGLDLDNVTAGGGNLNDLKSALESAPSVCMNLAPADFHDFTKGIYSNPEQKGRFWERESSLEIINTDGTSAVQKDCGIRIRGGDSRDPTNPKHAFHLYFRSLYDGDLIHPLFGSEGNVTRFDQIDMRCEQNHSWSRARDDENSLIREQFARKAQGDQGQPYSRGSYFHLYINGLYWGIFNWQERTEADYAANQFGGDDNDYDTVKSSGSSGFFQMEVSDGNDIAWKQLFDLTLAITAEPTEAERTAIYFQMRGLNPDGSRNPNYPVLLNVDNLADYILNLFYTGGHDGPISTFTKSGTNNWFGVRRKDGERGFLFFAHDNEHSMGTSDKTYNRVGPWSNPNSNGNNWGQTWSDGSYRRRHKFDRFNPQHLHEALAYSAEYRMRFMDRVQKSFFNNGPLSESASVARINDLAAQVDPIIHAEAARWGDDDLNKDTWLNIGKAEVLSFILTGGPKPQGETLWPDQSRELLVTQQLQGYEDEGPKPLAATLTAPLFSGPTGGDVPAAHALTITQSNSGATIYYTTDGTDPRAIGGGTSFTALTGAAPITVTLSESSTIRARAYQNSTSEWSAITEATYIVAATPASLANIVISKIHYHPIDEPSPTSGEYLELLNISNQRVNLDGCQFTDGIIFTFDFPEGYLLEPGERCLLVRDEADFAAVFPSVSTSLIAGSYSGALSNGGEQITLLDRDGIAIKDFTYDDAEPWPSVTDGSGPALVLVSPENNPNHGLPSSWRASTNDGGLPGAEETPSYLAWQEIYSLNDTVGTADFDGDNLPNLLEYSLGSDPTSQSSFCMSFGQTTSGGAEYLTVICERVKGLDDIEFTMETSPNLRPPWTPARLLGSFSSSSTGKLVEVYRFPNSKETNPTQFLRAHVKQVP
ncbi:MAG: lamin tail domain-containing protein [Roseibacillus sp.]